MFVCGINKCLASFFVHGYMVFPPPFVEEIVFSQFCDLDTFVKDDLVIFMRFYSWALYSVSFVSVFLIYLTVLITVVLQYVLKSRNVDPLLFFFKIILAVSGPLRFHRANP